MKWAGARGGGGMVTHGESGPQRVGSRGLRAPEGSKSTASAPSGLMREVFRDAPKGKAVSQKYARKRGQVTLGIRE